MILILSVTSPDQLVRILHTTLLFDVHAVFQSEIRHQLSKATDHCITLCYRLWVGLTFAVPSCEPLTISLSLGETSNELISYTQSLTIITPKQLRITVWDKQ